MGLTDFFIDYVPMYNKFRAVSSILVIAEFTIPLLAIFALKEILSKPDTLKLKENRGGVIATLVLTAGVALILAVARIKKPAHSVHGRWAGFYIVRSEYRVRGAQQKGQRSRA